MALQETSEYLEERIRHQFPALFITLVSVLIGLVLADLVAEAQARMVLWPLSLATLRTWGQIGAQGASAMTAWVIYSHIGISRERIPMLADSFIAFVVPLTILIGTSLVGRAAIWPFFYYGSASLAVSLVTVRWLLHLSRGEAKLAALSRLLQTRGLFRMFYGGIPDLCRRRVSSTSTG